MRRSICTSLLLLCVALAPAAAMAAPISVGDSVKFTDRPGNTGGGEFLATVNGVEQFITFCLQKTEYIDFQTTFIVSGISTGALTDPANKGGDANGFDPLSPQTAWLYTQFRANTLSGYYFSGVNHQASANALQKAIWYFEGEIANPNNSFVTLANNAVAGGWTGLGNVRVMNLSFPDGREAQDQLMLVPQSTTTVPEPASLALFGTGMGLLAWQLRRRQRAHASADAGSK